MSSNVRRGKIPRPTQGVSEHLDEIITLDGFFGDWVHVFRSRNPGIPQGWSDDDVMYSGAATDGISPSDEKQPDGTPLTLLAGEGIAVSISHRSAPMPFVERNADFHQIRFYHRGEFLLETELGEIEVSAGDFVVIPKGLIYREVSASDDNAIAIFETATAVTPAEELWDSVGFTSFFVDYSSMALPEPNPDRGDPDEAMDLRLKFQGRLHTLSYDFHPCRDVVGWVGDPLCYRLNVWDVPGLGSSHGFLPPPAGAVLFGRDKSFFFNVMSPKPFPNVPGPEGSYGAPAHQNDYDEVWFNHAAPGNDETAAHLWHLPPSVPHPGLKRPPEYPDNPVERIPEVKLNFDTRSPLAWTPEAKQFLLPDPASTVYTSLMGTHIGVVAEESLRHVKR